jgi:hypothetical protein
METAREPTTRRFSASSRATKANTAPLSLRATAALWQRFNHLYGHRWESGYGPALNERGELSESAATWARALGPFGPEELAQGLRGCLDRSDGWPPTLPEFRELCQGPKLLAPYHRPFPPVLALPEPDSVKAARREKGLSVLAGLKTLLHGEARA